MMNDQAFSDLEYTFNSKPAARELLAEHEKLRAEERSKRDRFLAQTLGISSGVAPLPKPRRQHNSLNGQLPLFD